MPIEINDDDNVATITESESALTQMIDFTLGVLPVVGDDEAFTRAEAQKGILGIGTAVAALSSVFTRKRVAKDEKPIAKYFF